MNIQKVKVKGKWKGSNCEMSPKQAGGDRNPGRGLVATTRESRSTDPPGGKARGRTKWTETTYSFSQVSGLPEQMSYLKNKSNGASA